MAVPRASTPKHPLIYQCPDCKALTTLTVFSTTTAGLTLTCPCCEQVHFIPAPSSEGASAEEVAVGGAGGQEVKPEPALAKLELAVQESAATEVEASHVASKGTHEQRRCPKCSHRVAEGERDCPRCGLSFANVGITFHPERFSLPQNALEEKAFRLWEETLSHWESEAVHEHFIQFCQSQELLELAAFHYRRVKDEGGERADRAAQKLSRIVEMVQQQFLLQQARRSSSEQTVQRGKYAVMIGLLLLALTAFYVIWRAMSGSMVNQLQLP